MIIFNNVDIEDAVPGLKIEDIRVSPVSLIPTVRDRAIAPGEEFVRMREGTRTITATFAVIETNRIKRQNLLDNLTKWAIADKPTTERKPLPMSLPYHEGRLIDVVCTSLPSPSTRQWWESKLSVTFTAYEPYFYSPYEKTVNCGTELHIGGTAVPLIKITRTLTSAKSNQSYTDGKDTMTFSTVPKGDLEIDLNRQTATVSTLTTTTNIMQYFTFASSFIKPRTGQFTITGTGGVVYRERWA